VIYCMLYRMMTMTRPGPMVRDLRLGRGVTQKQLAARMGTTQSAIAALERATSNPTTQTVADALDALGYELRLGAVEKRPGVDESLIRKQLELTPAQRLEALEVMAEDARELVLAGAWARGELG
jgi:transcriptional regulator with XRE-family HTH domain